jgi:hypothetical protein
MSPAPGLTAIVKAFSLFDRESKVVIKPGDHVARETAGH